MKKNIIIGILLTVVTMMSCKTNSNENMQKNDLVDGKKLVALTFDDGPDKEKTPLVLDKLEKYDVVASFTLIGQNVNESTKATIERMVSMGCELNNHSWGWESMDTMTADEIKESISKTSEVIKKYSGKEPAFFRPPNLAISDLMYETVGLPFISGVLGMDWDGCNTSAEDRAKNVLDGVRDGAIILLHDVQPYPHPTPAALDIIIPELKKQGYEFVTVSELFRRKGVTPNPTDKTMWIYVE